MGFGGFIRRIREHLGLTQPQFAKAAGVSQQHTVSGWENEESVPPMETIERIVQLVDPHLTLDKCLRLPFEETEVEIKYRHILAIIAGISPAVLVEPPPRAKPGQVSPEANRGSGRKRDGPSGQ